MPSIIRETCFWIAASLLALMPFALAIDFGGVLWWSQFIAAITTSLVVLVTAVGLVASKSWSQISKQVLLVPLLLWVAFAWFQTVSLPASVVAWLSPASVTAHTDWVAPYVDGDQTPGWFPVSVSVTDSRHSIAVLCIAVSIAWCSATVFDSRMRLIMLLNVIAIGAATVAAIGLWRRVFPDLGFLGIETQLSSSSFATFVNRNNAALLLNLGVAASLGVLSWRLTALTGQEVDDPDFEFSDLFSLINDRDSMIGIASATLCVSGLLVGGSRGGVVAALIGILIAFGWVRQRRGLASLPVIASVVGLCAAILLVPTNLSLESIQRFEVLTSSSQSTLLNDGRLRHWPDGLRAAAAHFPFGSGLGTYGDAVRPHQRTSNSSGFAHADNLWVELVTEQGVFGVLLALAIIFLVVRSLQRMGQSADPIDLGLRITGWFTLAALVTSQAFDFGLIIPANLFAVAIIFPTIVARDIAAGTAINSVPNANDATMRDRETFKSSDDEFDGQLLENRHRGLFATRTQRTLTITAATVTGLLLIPALSRLRADAKSDTILRELATELKWIKTNDTALSFWTERLRVDADDNPLPSTFESLCEVRFLQARLVDVAEQMPKTPAEASEIYQQTAPFQRRLKWNRNRDESNETPKLVENEPEALERAEQKPGSSEELYQQSLDYSSDAIRLRPLAQTPRPYQAYLDFIHRDRNRTRACLQHLVVVYAQEPLSLVKIGTLAADSGEYSLASNVWKTAITAQPSLTSQALSEATNHGLKTLGDLLPRTSANYRLAASYLLSNPQLLRTQKAKNTQNDLVTDINSDKDSGDELQLLRDCLLAMDCETCDTQIERANCEQLAGDAAYQLREFNECFAHYQEALRYDPMNAALRLKLVLRLKEQDRRRQALEEARKARMIIKDDPRFTQFIDAMAAEDRAVIENPASSPSIMPIN